MVSQHFSTDKLVKVQGSG